MPENNQILSVEGQLVGMPTAGPESFSAQQLDYLKRALGVDETVLYNNTSGNDGDVSLSEAITNFTKIKIYYSTTRAYTTGNYYYGGKYAEFDVADISTTNKIWISDSTGNGSSANTVVVKVQSYNITDSGTKFTWTVSTQLYYNGSTFTVSSAKSFVYKVVGIHRIAGGN